MTLPHSASSATPTRPSLFQQVYGNGSSTIDSSLPTAIAASLPETTPVWAAQIFLMLQYIALPFGLYFQPVVVTLAASWLVRRASQVLNKPLEELASLLGFDMPLTPIIDLAGIKADGCLIHWSMPEKLKQRSKYKYEIHLNGIVIDTVSAHESAVTITGLQPSSFYVVRVALINEQELGTRSEPIRFRTKPAASAEFYVTPLDPHDTDYDGASEMLPRVRLHRGLKDITPTAIEAAPMVREGSTGLAPKRSIPGRRSSPAALCLDQKLDSLPDAVMLPDGMDSVSQLTERLDALRRETAEAERLAQDEDEEESRLKDELTAERDSLRAEVAEKERASRSLKKEVSTLERQNTAAQNERLKLERLLSQKKQERAKLTSDMLRWAKEAEEHRADAERVQQSKVEMLEEMEIKKTAFRAQLAAHVSATHALEDEVREKNSEYKRLERAMKSTTPDDAVPDTHVSLTELSLVQQMQQEAEEERQWQSLRASLVHQYAATSQKLEEARRFYDSVNRYLQYVRNQRRQDDERNAAAAVAAAQSVPQQYVSPSPVERTIRRGDSQRSRRAQSGQSMGDSPQLNPYPLSSLAGANISQPPALSAVNGFSAITAGPVGGTAFFNIHNGTTLHSSNAARVGADEYMSLNMSEEERERLTGGAPMSPGAGADLLPADLFSGADETNRHERAQILPGLGALPGLPSLAGAAPPPPFSDRFERNGELSGAGPASPGSASSRSPSVFASPRASQNNLHLGSPVENMNLDPDRRSIRSTRSGRAGTSAGTPVASSRFSSMFGIKPRTKSLLVDDDGGMVGPALGKAQSHSMPRQEGQGLPGLGTISGFDGARKRNSSMSGATVFPPPGMGGDFASDPAFGSEPGSLNTPQSVHRRRPFGAMASIFSRDSSTREPKADKDGTVGWPSSFTTSFARRSGSPRPGSTHSSELPRPSVDGSRWVVGVGGEGWPTEARSSPLSFPTGPWSVPSTGDRRLYGSRHPSRRPSVQHGVSGPPEDIMEDELSGEDDDAVLGQASKASRLAPIGTRPVGRKSTIATAQMNPADGSDPSTTLAASEKKLNPAAKDFKSFFGMRNKDKTTRAGSPGQTNTAGGPSGLRDPTEIDDSSPPTGRKSRDTRSMTTTESSIADSADQQGGAGAYDLARTPSYTNSDAAGPSPLIGSTTSKESFMSKLTRKSSSGKFSLPTFKREKSKLDPAQLPPPATPTTVEMMEEEDETMAASVGSLQAPRESKDGGSRASGRSWSSVLKLGKGRDKKGGEAPSLSGVSAASGADTEEGESTAEYGLLED